MDPNLPTIQEPVAPIEPTQDIPNQQKDGHGITIAAMAIFVLLSLSAVVFLYYQNQQLKSMLASYTSPTTKPQPTPTSDPTANWKTYTNKQYGFTFKYPSDWEDVSKSDAIANPNREFMLQTSNKEFVNGTVFDKYDSTFVEQPWSKQLKLGQTKSLVVTYVNSIGPGSKGGEKDLPTFNQILSTFEFSSETSSSSATIKPTSTSSAQPNLPN